VHRHTTDRYLVVLRAEAHEQVRAEPFDAIELHVAVLLGDDPDECRLARLPLARAPT
jgi:hypothetical protein